MRRRRLVVLRQQEDVAPVHEADQHDGRVENLPLRRGGFDHDPLQRRRAFREAQVHDQHAGRRSGRRWGCAGNRVREDDRDRSGRVQEILAVVQQPRVRGSPLPLLAPAVRAVERRGLSHAIPKHPNQASERIQDVSFPFRGRQVDRGFQIDGQRGGRLRGLERNLQPRIRRQVAQHVHQEFGEGAAPQHRDHPGPAARHQLQPWDRAEPHPILRRPEMRRGRIKKREFNNNIMKQMEIKTNRNYV